MERYLKGPREPWLTATEKHANIYTGMGTSFWLQFMVRILAGLLFVCLTYVFCEQALIRKRWSTCSCINSVMGTRRPYDTEHTTRGDWIQMSLKIIK